MVIYTSFMSSSAQEEPQFYESFEKILHGCSWEIISETSQAPIKTLVQHFEQKNICSDISLPRLGKNISIALQNMTESPSPPLLPTSLPKNKRKTKRNQKIEEKKEKKH